MTSSAYLKQWKGELRYSALQAAKDFFEISRPVNIRRMNGHQRRGTAYYRNGEHCITISTYSTIAEAAATILHELAHAAQLERFEDPKDFYRAYAAESAKRGYRANKYEVEARAAAELVTDFEVAR